MYFDANIPCLQATVCRALLIFKTTTSKFRGSAGPRSTFEQNWKDAAQKNMALKIESISSLSVSLKLDILQIL
ncbi:serine/threonine- protein phosphatase regulatory subunit B beta, partial [Trichinella spiralis]|uniref:serine/threonine- protein phosphatase regulatory subunit B beta n=1 Tax=Trichinella spiralis TaxID=6334 RepID=UPI0001EFCD49